MKSFPSTKRYKSSIISNLKQEAMLRDKMKKDKTPLTLDYGTVRFFLPRHFGFCYGVENAIEITFQALKSNPEKRIFLLSELIHNPYVNAYFEQRGIKFMMKPSGERLIDFATLNSDDIVIVPAFGTTVEIENELTNIGVTMESYHSTCPFVVKVWNRAKKIAEKGYSVIIHGTPTHEETRATFSHVEKDAACVVVRNMADAYQLVLYIKGEKKQEEFDQEFRNLSSKSFDVVADLKRIGLVNQTTMLAEETKAINVYLKEVMAHIHNIKVDDQLLNEYVANTSDTLCYATSDNQRALRALLDSQQVDAVFAVGGYNSSNTSHLAEMCLEKDLVVYYVQSQENIKGMHTIEHFDIQTKKVLQTENYLPQKHKSDIPQFLLIGGASCPDILIEEVIEKIASFYPGATLRQPGD